MSNSDFEKRPIEDAREIKERDYNCYLNGLITGLLHNMSYCFWVERS